MSKMYKLDDLIVQYGCEYLRDRFPEKEPIPMDEIDEYFGSVSEALEKAYHGYRWEDCDKPFCPYDNFFVVYCDRLISLDFPDEYLLENVDEDDFMEWVELYKHIDTREVER